MTRAQIASGLDRGVQLEVVGDYVRATYSVTADSMMLACRVAMGRWAQLTESLQLPYWDLIDLHVRELGSLSRNS